MGKGGQHQGFFTGAFSIKTTLIALAKILESRDPRFESIAVRGELIVEPGEGIRTRSKLRAGAFCVLRSAFCFLLSAPVLSALCVLRTDFCALLFVCRAVASGLCHFGC